MTNFEMPDPGTWTPEAVQRYFDKWVWWGDLDKHVQFEVVRDVFCMITGRDYAPEMIGLPFHDETMAGLNSLTIRK